VVFVGSRLANEGHTGAMSAVGTVIVVFILVMIAIVCFGGIWELRQGGPYDREGRR